MGDGGGGSQEWHKDASICMAGSGICPCQEHYRGGRSPGSVHGYAKEGHLGVSEGLGVSKEGQEHKHIVLADETH